MFNHLLLSVGIALASVLLLAGPPAWGSTSACDNAWEQSTASQTCEEPTFTWGNYQKCSPCCVVDTWCETGGSITTTSQRKRAFIVVRLDKVDDLENCHGTLKVDSC